MTRYCILAKVVVKTENMNLEEKKLAEEATDGNDAAFEQLMKIYLKPVYNFLFQIIKDPSIVDDLTQETFIKAWKNIGRFDTEKSFKTWVFTIAKNTAYDYLRKKKSIPFSFFKKKGSGRDLEDISADNLLPNEILERNDLAKELGKNLQKIPINQRVVLFLHYKEDLSLLEISEVLKKPYNTVKSLHGRGLSRLKKVFLENNASN